SSGSGPSAPSASSSPHNSPSSGSAPGAAAAVGSKGITYSPYTKDHQCKSAQDVKLDLQKLQDYDVIRLYSTDCSGIENVLAALSSNQQLFLGVWNIDSNSVQGGLSDILKALQTSNRGWSAVHTIAIGNEQVNAGTASPSQIGSAISTARSWLKQNAPQYSGPVVSVDTLVAVVSHPELCEYSDYLAVNSHPYWDGNVSPSDSGQWLQQQISNLRNACGSSKEILITETGWPTQGKPFGNCVPSVQNQVDAMKSIVSELGSQVIAFTMYNDYWKDPGQYGVELYWGLFGNPDE
ncbi:glycoside hydrolase family 17 protein, partial [Suhomyces tanzawaensis NRRL Y-17324]